jgi:copper oxidase (laccase) domain-containing protein
MANMCTYCHPEGFLSYRRDKTTQRHATCITLCP